MISAFLNSESFALALAVALFYPVSLSAGMSTLLHAYVMVQYCFFISQQCMHVNFHPFPIATITDRVEKLLFNQKQAQNNFSIIYK